MEKKVLFSLTTILLLAGVLNLPTSIFAETIILKSGQKIEAKIIEKTDDYIVIDFSGSHVSYAMYEIESIREGKSASTAPKEKAPSQEIASSYIEENFNKGIEYATQGKLEEAKKEFEKTLEIDPIYTTARSALEIIEDVIGKKIKKETAIYIFKGMDYGNQGMWSETIAEHNKAIANEPNYANAYFYRGLIYYMVKQKYKQAIADFSKAIKLNPKYADAYLNRGAIYENQRQYDQAISDYSKVIEITPRDAEAYYNRGNAYAGQGNPDKAITDYTEAIRINPNFYNAYCNRGNVYYLMKGNLDQAIFDYNKVLENNPNDAQTYYNRASAYAEQGNVDQAMSDFNKAIIINSQNAEPYFARAVMYFLKQNYDKSWADVYKAEELGFRVDREFIAELKKASGRER